MRHTTKLTVGLWTVQGLLTLLFLFAGGMKLVMPAEMMGDQMPFPVLFMRFIGLAETAGALGLVLPGLFRLHIGLTPLAAAGLVVIMIGATTTTIAMMGVAPALFPAVVGVLAASVAYGRWRMLPSTASARALQLQPAR